MFSSSKLMCRGDFWVGIDASGCFLAHNWCLWVLLGQTGVSGCFPVQNVCLRVFSGLKLMSQGTFFCQYRCLRVFSGPPFVSRGVFGAKIDASCSELTTKGQTCPLRVFSGHNSCSA